MPKIPQKALHTVFYLYKTKEDADLDRDRQGTGFLVSLPSILPDRRYAYLVTNWHVAVKHGASIVRINRRDGISDVFAYEVHEWEFLEGYDIAVTTLTVDRSVPYDVVTMHDDFLLTQDHREQWGIGVGDEVFMLGLFAGDYGEHNIVSPSARFGHISIDAVPLKQDNGRYAESYCLDMHSRPGYSGSPVFVYRLFGHDLNDPPLKNGQFHLALLGIHWGQFPERWEVTSEGKMKDQTNRERHEPLLTDGQYIKGLSGMTCVLPAWSILEVLNNIPKFKEQRDRSDAEIRKSEEYRRYLNAPVPEGS